MYMCAGTTTTSTSPSTYNDEPSRLSLTVSENSTRKTRDGKADKKPRKGKQKCGVNTAVRDMRTDHTDC
jgi:hypothetical protein